jgi:heme-degrading monooxygenase HmoA
MADRMVELASSQPGFLGIESAREEVDITVSYWADIESITAWKANVGGWGQVLHLTSANP